MIAQAQQTTTQAPPIPPLPARAGEATGAAPRDGRDAAGDATENARVAIQNAIEAAGNAGNAVVIQPPRLPGNEIPPEVVPIVGMVFGSFVAIAVVTAVSRFATRVFEKRMDRSVLRADVVQNQLQQLQTSLDTMSIEIERISEAQRFQAKLMAERDRVALPDGRGGA
jgi:hypothetical protein